MSNLEAIKNRESAHSYHREIGQLAVKLDTIVLVMKCRRIFLKLRFLPVIKPLCALIIPVFTIPGCTALIVTFAFLACKISIQKIN